MLPHAQSTAGGVGRRFPPVLPETWAGCEPEKREGTAMSYWTDMRTPTEAELVVGMYDLTNYTAFGQRATPLEVLDVMTRYHAFAGQLFHAAGGILIKTAGDAGLFAFRDID